MIRVISFDIDDTLYDFETVSLRALDFVLQRFHEALGPTADGLNREEVIADLVCEMKAVPNSCVDLPDLRRRSFLKTMQRRGRNDPALAAELNDIYLDHRYENIRPFDNARIVLSELSERYTLCIVSNGEQGLDQLGLDDLFSFTVFAYDVGLDKPDPGIFHAAMQRAGCKGHEFVHVGDSETSDVQGVKAAGGYAIWFNPTGKAPATDVSADAQIRSLDELPAAIAGLNGAL